MAYTLEEYKLQALEKGYECIADEYLGTHEPILHRCKKGHVWKVRPNDIKRGKGCPFCSSARKFTLEECKLQALEKGYECIADEYLGIDEPILYQCKKQHIWKARPGSIKRGGGCPFCYVVTLNEYRSLAIEKGYECIADEYLGSITPILHRCKNGHTFLTSPSRIQQGHGCLTCARINSSSKPEKIVRAWLEKRFQNEFPCVRPRWLKNRTGRNLELDCFCEKLKLAVEYNGEQHYSPRNHYSVLGKFDKIQANDTLKAKLCVDNEVELVIVPYWEKNVEAFLENYFSSLYLAL
jgi:hypothetical protein